MLDEGSAEFLQLGPGHHHHPPVSRAQRRKLPAPGQPSAAFIAANTFSRYAGALRPTSLARSSHDAEAACDLVGRPSIGRTAARDITVFKSVGLAIEDLVAARLVAARSAAAEPGQPRS